MGNSHSNLDLHGAAPDTSSIALLIIDMLSDFQASQVRTLQRTALQVAKRIAALKQRATAAGIPCIYVNDNVGRWQSAGQRVIEQNSAAESSSFPISKLMMPGAADYLVLKPKHSAFFATPLDVLLSHLGVSALIITGTVGKQCILFTAMDAYVREFQLYIPLDCVVTSDRSEIAMLKHLFVDTLDAEIRSSEHLRMTALKRKHGVRPLRR